MGRKKKKKQGAVMQTPKAPTSKPNDASKMSLFIPRNIYDKVMYWVNKSRYEVSGFGSLEYDEKEHYFVVTDVILLKQKVGATSTEIEAEAMGKAMYRMRDNPGGLKWHWHSHVDMNVFWSSDDMEIIRSLGQQGWIVASVFNKKEEIKSAFYSTSTVLGKAHDVFFDDLDTQVYHNLTDELKKELDDEYDANVTVDRPPVVVTTPSTIGRIPYHNSFLDDGWDPYGYMERHASELAETKGEIPADNKYNEFGYVQVGDDWLYNPVHDHDLIAERDKALAIDDMTQEEINFLKGDTKFAALLQRYVVMQAELEATDATV